MGESSLSFDGDWQDMLRRAVLAMIEDPVIRKTIHPAHTQNTPDRVVDYFKEALSGCLEKPDEIVSAKFLADGYDQMIHVKKIMFYSLCAHHCVPFFGVANFAYIPDDWIVGLSKIPRLVHAYARRPQVQEKLTNEIVDKFEQVVAPKGCGLVMRAYHFCMIARGVREPGAYTETTALRGCFIEGGTKSEFLASQQGNDIIWG